MYEKFFSHLFGRKKLISLDFHVLYIVRSCSACKIAQNHGFGTAYIFFGKTRSKIDQRGHLGFRSVARILSSFASFFNLLFPLEKLETFWISLGFARFNVMIIKLFWKTLYNNSVFLVVTFYRPCNLAKIFLNDSMHSAHTPFETH